MLLQIWTKTDDLDITSSSWLKPRRIHESISNKGVGVCHKPFGWECWILGFKMMANIYSIYSYTRICKMSMYIYNYTCFFKVMPTSGQEFLSERFLFETRIVGFRDTLSRSKARRMIMILSAKLTKRWRATPQDSSSFFQAKNPGFVLNIVYIQYIYIYIDVNGLFCFWQ